MFFSKLSGVGKARVRVYALLLACDLVVLALSARVNIFQEFFLLPVAADLFPFALSIVTLVVLLGMMMADLAIYDAVITRPAFELAWLGVLSFLWLETRFLLAAGFNAFSSSRWAHLTPSMCGNIPIGYEAEKLWCQEMVALRAFVWIEWVILFLSFGFLLRYVTTRSAEGDKHIWTTSLSRFVPNQSSIGHLSFTNVQGEFIQWEKFPSH
ncbi:hypothetical protein SISNIDRAFT_464780 [Sistotremastrum niveocremeum HHB9708]|uniref:Transmembrane protein n=1 Tax=Sistotremastrum niveocremeum HHB9708 TaxID=1314777 RepID=A0A164WKA5_9AGAM|nr:hypothetical protein SISNIDRAFT_464780 [Sistotremastrum niveocremeum HHB9708]